MFRFVLILALLGGSRANPTSDIDDILKEYPNSVVEFSEFNDGDLTVPELIEKYGYPVETHHVINSDGYILELHRIPYGKNQNSTIKRQVAYLQHGLLCSSADWVIAGPGKGLAYLLADAGYDVWLGNARGNVYSRRHVTLDPDSDAKKFWDFSWHEIGTVDVPAMIDFALEHTGQSKLFHIGHSQGTTTFYVMCSERPEYNDKIIAHFSLAPIAFMKHMTSPLLQIVSIFPGGLEAALKVIGMNEFLPNDGLLSNVSEAWCDKSILQSVCTNAIFVLCGFNKAQMNTTLLPVILKHTPAGAASKQVIHYIQEIKSGFFRQYDYGLIKNIKIYNKFSPPNYKLANIDAPIYMFNSKNDWMSAEVDVNRLYNELPNVQGKFLVTDPKWNHLDFIWGIQAPELLYNKVISLMSDL
ncbi:PREDICTED: lipase 3-like [Nicrophorus vespilloides]|uniref:Lipase n=1 Tax=Nicrophorus vespilloides TaxID=110193 RepID=A0ABM1M7I9_NICVS|nr:PREDICTED: lipase 3-like [Nicrophorus vespilloides]